MKAKYVSVWDGGTTVTTNCDYYPKINVVSDIESSNIEGLEVLDDEYILLPDGSEIRDFINEDEYEGEITPTAPSFGIRLELESFNAKTPLEAVKEALRLMSDMEDGKPAYEGFIYDVTDNLTGKRYTVDMSEDDEDKVLPVN